MTPIRRVLQTNTVAIFVERTYFHDTIWAISLTDRKYALRRKRFHIDESSKASRYLNDFYTRLVIAESNFGFYTGNLPLMIPLSCIEDWAEETLDTRPGVGV